MKSRYLSISRSALLAILAGVTIAILAPVLPASAGGGTYGDTQDDIIYYDWDSDTRYQNQDWDELDIHTVAINADAGSVTVTTGVVDLREGWWKIFRTAYDVDGDSVEDYRMYLFWDGTTQLYKVSGVQDSGSQVGCDGMAHQLDYAGNRVAMTVPRGCIGNTGSVGVALASYDSEDYSCDCNDTLLDVWPNQVGTYSPMIPYSNNTTPPPSSGSYDPNGPMGTIYRLYKAYFLREPDRAGYDYWLGVYRNGYPLTDISENFTRSQEFQQSYGNLDIPQYIRMVYKNVLDREPDPAGYNYWADQMANRGMPRGVVMINFSDSQEFRSRTASGRPPGY